MVNDSKHSLADRRHAEGAFGASQACAEIVYSKDSGEPQGGLLFRAARRSRGISAFLSPISKKTRISLFVTL